jgi:flavorubredoxin
VRREAEMDLVNVGKVLLVIIVILGAAVGIVLWKINLETVTQLKTVNPTSSGPRVIVVYSPGISDFHQRMVDAFISGLVASGWSVDIVTASSQAPVDLTSYSLLVIGGPLYGGQPSKPIQDYMARLTDLKGLRVYTLLSTAGSPRNADQIMTTWITTHKGVEAGKLILYTMAPNETVDEVSDPTLIAAKTAQSLVK